MNTFKRILYRTAFCVITTILYIPAWIIEGGRLTAVWLLERELKTYNEHD